MWVRGHYPVKQVAHRWQRRVHPTAAPRVIHFGLLEDCVTWASIKQCHIVRDAGKTDADSRHILIAPVYSHVPSMPTKLVLLVLIQAMRRLLNARTPTRPTDPAPRISGHLQ
ncbi:hypothetical protein AB1N83_007818 [Pleurotus pulmonarius]